MSDPLLGTFIRHVINKEIIPYVPLPREETEKFATAVSDRFQNPYIDHALLSISLNSVSKWKTRVLPSLRDYYASHGRLPRLLTFSFAALLAFYRTDRRCPDGLSAVRQAGDWYTVRDDAEVLNFFSAHSGESSAAYVVAVAANTAFWGEDLTAYPGLTDRVTCYLEALELDARQAVRMVLEE